MKVIIHSGTSAPYSVKDAPEGAMFIDFDGEISIKISDDKYLYYDTEAKKWDKLEGKNVIREDEGLLMLPEEVQVVLARVEPVITEEEVK